MDAIAAPLVHVLDDLAAAALEVPSQVFVLMDDVPHTFAEVHRRTDEIARGLVHVGVQPGDRILLLLPNGIEALWAWWGSHRAGAVDVPVSIEATGASLAHVVNEVEPRVVIGAPELVGRLRDAAVVGSIETAVIVGGTQDAVLGPAVRHLSLSELHQLGESAELPPVPTLAEVATVMFSSGTTGPPKGVMLPHGYYPQTVRAYDDFFELPVGATVYSTQPLCHIDPRIVLIDILRRRGRLVLKGRFSASQFWPDVERYDADAFCFIGAMLHLIHKQPKGDEGTGRRRLGMGSAVPADIHQPFSERFNVDLMEGYGMTEFYSMTSQRPGELTPGNVGRELPTVELRVVDDQDEPLPDGEVGQLIVRPRRPYAHMMGYWNRPEATVEAWRGLWFHTGDLMRRQADGTFQYVGRLKDSIRRRGENVSAWEVEQVAMKHDSVLEAAAIGVPADVGDEDVALFVVPRPGRGIDAVALRAAMAQDLPKFALPRFVEIVETLPKTPSERVAKGVLRERGLTESAHDVQPQRSGVIA